MPLRQNPVEIHHSVDVLIVSHQTCDVLEKCLESISTHRPPRGSVTLNVRVFDNASIDGTVEMVRRRFPEIVLRTSEENTGFGAANNALAAESQADFLLLLNPDTVWRSDIVSPLIAELEGNRDAVVAGPRLVSPDGRLQPSSQHFPSLADEFAAAIRGTKLSALPILRRCEETIARAVQANFRHDLPTRSTDFLWATCWLLRREYIDRHGLFDVRFPLYDEDLDFCYQLRAAGGKAIYVPSVELVHLGGASSTPTRKLKLMRHARARYYRAHHGLAAAFVYRFFVGLLWRVRLRRGSLPRGA